MKKIIVTLFQFIQIQLLTGLILGPILACFFPLDFTFWAVLLSSGTLVALLTVGLHAVRSGLLGTVEMLNLPEGDLPEPSTDTSF